MTGPGKNPSESSVSAESGMTLLEIIFAVSLMMIMTFATASVLRNGLDLRMDLSQRSKVTHKLNVALDRVSKDLQHAFLISSNQVFERKAEIKTLFKVKAWDNSNELRLTTMNHEPKMASATEGDQAFVVYRIDKDSSTQRPSLFRGELSIVPENLEEDIPMSVLGTNIKAIRIAPWDGENWKEDWDSTRADWRDLLPHMVKVEIEAYMNEPEIEGEPFGEKDPTVTVRSVVFIPRSILNKEIKDAPKEPRYDL